MNGQSYAGKELAEAMNGRRQDVPCLGLRAAHPKISTPRVVQLGRNVLDALRLTQGAASVLDNVLSGFRHAREAASVAGENLETELALQQQKLPAHRGLSGVEL